ncbi:hypothetical protein BC835DRAFT_32431 [Cytidiella melzeri]|nr:hypothetical protein BC835DRAFT_32431 [Cytidiella melzeri]
MSSTFMMVELNIGLCSTKVDCCSPLLASELVRFKTACSCTLVHARLPFFNRKILCDSGPCFVMVYTHHNAYERTTTEQAQGPPTSQESYPTVEGTRDCLCPTCTPAQHLRKHHRPTLSRLTDIQQMGRCRQHVLPSARSTSLSLRPETHPGALLLL